MFLDFTLWHVNFIYAKLMLKLKLISGEGFGHYSVNIRKFILTLFLAKLFFALPLQSRYSGSEVHTDNILRAGTDWNLKKPPVQQ